jgi:hypothetical protein
MIEKRILRLLREFASDSDTPPGGDTLRLNTQTGHPLASALFLSKLETKLGRRLRPLPSGRPKGWC